MLRTTFIYLLPLLFTAAVILTSSCDPYNKIYWYIENQLYEDIIVTRSDSTEIRNVHIKAGDKGCIFYSIGLYATFDDLEESFSSKYNSDTLVILNTTLDTLFKFHPKNKQNNINKLFWERDSWIKVNNNEDHTIIFLFVLKN